MESHYFTGTSLAHNRADITYTIKGKNKTLFIEVTIPGDSCILHKVVERRDRYADLYILVNKLWQTSASVVLIMIGMLGSIPSGLTFELQLLGLHPLLCAFSRRHYCLVLLETCTDLIQSKHLARLDLHTLCVKRLHLVVCHRC